MEQARYPSSKKARLAGFLYLIVVLTGIFSLAYVPSRLIVWDDPARTFHNIAASTPLFRLGILSSMICYLAFLLLPLVLYQLLNRVNELYAKLMVIFAFVSVPISFLNMQNKYAVLPLVDGAAHLKVFDEAELHSQVFLFLDNYNNGILIVQLFWGLWLLPFGYLVYKSGFLPKILGVFLMIGCFGYLVSFVGNTIMPHYSENPIAGYIRIPASIGEIGTCLWLLIMGVKNKKGFSTPGL